MSKDGVAASSAGNKTRAGATTQLGHYQLLDLLGVGGMAEVFRGRTSGPGGFERTVVVKRILPANAADSEFVRMFVAEAKILGMLHHPNVVQAYDFGEIDDTLFLVLEYVDGPSLGRVMRACRTMGQKIPPAIAAHFAHELCRALDYVHTLTGGDGEPLRIVHRDVTPSNVVLTATGGLKLLDFGVAKFGASEAHTQNGTLKGKPAYLAPEAIKGQAFDHRLDIFAVGVLLHEMLTLNVLFGSDNDLITLHKVMEQPIPRPSEHDPEVPPALDAIVMRALERDPDARYPTAAEMASDLNAFVVAGQLHSDQVVAFVRDIQAHLAATTRPKVATVVSPNAATAVDTTQEGEGGPTRRDIGLRFRMSRLGRLLFGGRGRRPRQ
ncbi:MAG TPA: serine/threonine-protein kinase [Polyangia bacterium]|nr:serine/threonine-protein kinase [Polyangia bacterium]